MRCPTYSISRVPAGIARVANAPSPWVGEERTLKGSFTFDPKESKQVLWRSVLLSSQTGFQERFLRNNDNCCILDNPCKDN